MTTSDRISAEDFMRDNGFTVGVGVEVRPGNRVRFAPSRNASMPKPRLHKAPVAKYHTNVIKVTDPDAPMTGPQASKIAIMASKVFKSRKVQGWKEDDWRHEQCLQVVSKKLSSGHCTQRDFLILKAHFELLAGDVGKSVETAGKAVNDGNAKDQLMFIVEEILTGLPPRPNVPADHVPMPDGKARGTAWGWANAISRSKFRGANLTILDCSQLQHMIIFLRKAVAKKRKDAGLTNAKKAKEPKPAKAPKAPKPVKAMRKAGKQEIPKVDILPCRCGSSNVTVNTSLTLIKCHDCNRSIEGDDFAKIAARWNKGGQAQ